jgi:hypothetical protein
MTSKYCKKCGKHIERKIPYTNKKTRQSRNVCYECNPPSIDCSERHKRKVKLVKILGGKCVRCGYDKSITALSFHHKDPHDKEFDISSNGNLIHKEWDVLLTEVMKCELLCLNCHAVEHNEHDKK